jgi:uncharacterized membrane protein YwzB
MMFIIVLYWYLMVLKVPKILKDPKIPKNKNNYYQD